MPSVVAKLKLQDSDVTRQAKNVLDKVPEALKKLTAAKVTKMAPDIVAMLENTVWDLRYISHSAQKIITTIQVTALQVLPTKT